jgi:hypothetical protein
MDELVNILMRRDGISESESLELIGNCQEEIDEILNKGGSYYEAEESLRYWLGLEPDYMEYFL